MYYKKYPWHTQEGVNEKEQSKRHKNREVICVRCADKSGGLEEEYKSMLEGSGPWSWREPSF